MDGGTSKLRGIMLNVKYVRTAQMAYTDPEISCVDMDTECMGASHLAHVAVICSKNEVHVKYVRRLEQLR